MVCGQQKEIVLTHDYGVGGSIVCKRIYSVHELKFNKVGFL